MLYWEWKRSQDLARGQPANDRGIHSDREAWSRPRTLTLKLVARDKYFRVLALIVADGLELADEMVKAGLANAYGGGTKQHWCPKRGPFHEQPPPEPLVPYDGRPRSPTRSVLGACLLPIAFPLAQHSAWLNFKKLPLLSLAEVQASSEAEGHPISLAFDDGEGPGGDVLESGQSTGTDDYGHVP